MDPLTLALIGGGVGLGKNLLFDQPAEKKDRAVAAAVARFSPWTHLDPGNYMPKRADMFGSVLQGGTTGAMLGQGMQNQDAYNSYLGSQTAANQAATTAPYMMAPGSTWQSMANQNMSVGKPLGY